jgi:hypothetical protein
MSLRESIRSWSRPIYFHGRNATSLTGVAAVDLRVPGVRQFFGYVALATVINLLIIGTASYRGVEYMDSPNFYGTTCHTVMAPEYTAYQNSPHAHVACVECHIGPGAPWISATLGRGFLLFLYIRRQTASASSRMAASILQTSP